MKILITGGSGFIGGWLAHALAAAGHAVTIFDEVAPSSDAVPYVVGDVRDLESLCAAAAGMDVIYNLAARHSDHEKPFSVYESVNVGGARNVCLAAERAGIATVIFTSSAAVYGESEQPLREDDPHRFINEYGRTKSAAEAVHVAWAQADPGRRLLIVRPAVVFGPGNRGNVYNLLRQISSGLFVMVGPGVNRKSMAYVENIVAFLAGGLAAPAGVSIFNYADKPDLDMNALVALIRRELGKGEGVGPRLPLGLARVIGVAAAAISAITGRTLPISPVRIAKFAANTEMDTSRLLATGFVAPHDLQTALISTLDADLRPPAAQS